MSTTITLNCWIIGEPCSFIFTIEIVGSKTVSALKDAIKDKNKHSFQHVDAKTLVLWKVSISDDEDLEDNVEKLNLNDKPPLRALTRLSSLFANQPEDSHLNIVVQAPTIPHPALSSEPFQLNCLVLGKPRSFIFTIEIAGTKTVSALKDAIKDENKHSFQHVGARTLVLWKVSIPDDESLQANVHNLKLDAEVSLSPMDRLSKVFSDILEGHLHIVVTYSPS